MNAALSADFGDSQYLGEAGRIVLSPGPPALLGPNRHDNFVSWDATLSYVLNAHFNMSASYSWFRNWSTIAFADFVRSLWSVNASTRW